ncbi:class I SAM-dependent methyltransferase [Methanoregula sp.]|uniref:class I SAM-dependent DNA methyltransferase n=1 Tax=Methanoregula sp. TaxID=2052170 RepID=UPI0026190D61|nr:class I SAM-dependent methyltransferase [Methanoregula sp.]MDD5143795.1 class I SAM-dependent methyltransferase [Methanoregula sp.]
MNEETTIFDNRAAAWDDIPRRAKLAADVARAICNTVKIIPEMDVLDFGCGTGLLTLRFQPLARSITGIDSSKGMLAVLEEKIREQGLTNVTAQCIDVENGKIPDGKYDLIVSSMTFHHIRDVQPVLAILSTLLKPAGTLAIADLDNDNGKFHDTPEGVFHNGFDRYIMKNQFEAAGLTCVRNRTAAIVQKESPSGEIRPFTVFLMTGRKEMTV